METERMTLSQRERDRMRVLHEVQQEHLTQREAAKRLQLSPQKLCCRRLDNLESQLGSFPFELLDL